MIHAYDKRYLERARVALGRMLDFAVYDLQMDLQTFWTCFLESEVSSRFEQGDSSLLAGMSGIEMAYAVLGENSKRISARPVANRSEEYWLGWALAYYQWETGLSFRDMFAPDEICTVLALYSPYHEMDIRHFCNQMREIYLAEHPYTNLKRYRLQASLSQAVLAEETGIPLRTIQQYEQRQKNINAARAEVVVRLAKGLCCRPEDLLEKVQPTPASPIHHTEETHLH